jgi:hypothetical protein
MAETLGSLCDKLTIVKLKEWHSEKQPERLRTLAMQEQQLREEIDAFIADAASGRIPVERLTFAANKVYRKEGNPVPEVTGGIGAVFSHLAEVNCRLWHEVDKGYEIEKVPPDARDGLVKQLALLNLERSQCIDEIDRQLRAAVEQLQPEAIKH